MDGTCKKCTFVQRISTDRLVCNVCCNTGDGRERNMLIGGSYVKRGALMTVGEYFGCVHFQLRMEIDGAIPEPEPYIPPIKIERKTTGCKPNTDKDYNLPFEVFQKKLRQKKALK